jgi:hypothetical protein
MVVGSFRKVTFGRGFFTEEGSDVTTGVLYSIHLDMHPAGKSTIFPGI